MITREEYECKLSRFVGNVTNHTLHEMFKVINEYQNGLEQHIKSLEAQLANTEQLTCKDCSMYGANFGNGYDRNYCTKLNMFTNDCFGCILYKKDTK